MRRTLLQSSPVAWRICAPTVRRATAGPVLPRPRGATSMSYSGCQLAPPTTYDTVAVTCDSARQPMVTADGAVGALALAADLRELAAEPVRGLAAGRAARRPACAAPPPASSRRARSPSSVFAHPGVYGFGLRISSVSVAEKTPPNAPTSSSSAAIAVLRASLALDVGLGLCRAPPSARGRADRRRRARSPARSARPITSAASRTSPRNVRMSSAAGSRSNVARAVPFSQRTVRARVTRARSANTTTLSILSSLPAPWPAAARAAVGASAQTETRARRRRVISFGRAASPWDA